MKVFKDYYEILGIAHGASKDEIKAAFRKKALENASDPGSRDKPEAEVNAQNSRMRDIIEAADVLRNAAAKEEYDGLWKQAHGVASESTDFGQLLNAMLDKYDIKPRSLEDELSDIQRLIDETRRSMKDIGNRTRDGFENPFLRPTEESTLKTPQSIEVLESDLPLLAGLRRAYSEGGEGRWAIGRPPSDDRKGLPSEMYEIQSQENGTISVSRRLSDWYNRSDPIRLYGRNERGQPVLSREFPTDALFSEDYLSEEGSRNLQGVYVHPGYEGYLATMKRLAKKLADDPNADILTEVTAINEFTNRAPRTIREKNRRPGDYKQAIREISLADFPTQLQQSEGLIRRAELGSPEGQINSTTESLNTQMGGEKRI